MASKIQGITVEIGGDTTKLGKALESVNSNSKRLQSELKGVNTLLKMDPSNVTLLKQKQELLNKSISECSEKLKILKSTQSDVQAQFERGEITEEQYRDFQREIIATENKLKSLKNEAKSFGNVATQEIANVGNKMKDLGSSIEKTGKKMSVISGGIVAAGTASVAAFNEVDEGADIAIKATGALGEQAKEIEQSYKNVAGAIVGDFSDIGSALGEVNTRFGFTGKELEECTTQFIKFGEVTGADVTESVQKISRYMGDASIDSSKYKNVLDNLTVACQASGISMNSLTENLVKYGAPMRALGFETEEAIAIFSQWEKAGVNTEIAFSGMKTAIANWSSKGKDARQEFKKTLEEIKKCPNVAKATTKAIEVFGKKAGPDLADAIQGGRFEYEDFLKLLQNSEGQLDGTYNEIIDGTDDAKLTMQNAKLTFAEIGETIMQLLAPALQKISGFLQSLKDKWKGLSSQTQGLIVKIAGIIAAIGPLLLIIGKLTSSLGAVLTYGPKILSVFSTIKSAVSGLFSLVAANPIILVIVAIIAAIVLLWNKCEWFRNLVIKLFNSIKKVLNKAWQEIKKIWDVVQPYFVAIWEKIKSSLKPVIENIMKAFSSAWETIKKVWEKAKPYFEKLWEVIKKLFSIYVNILGKYFKTLWTIIKTIWDKAGPFFINLWNGIKNTLSPVIKAIAEAFKAAWELIKTIWSYVQPYFNALWQAIKLIFSVVKEVLGTYWKLAWEYIKVVWDVAVKYFTMLWENIKAVFSVVATVVGGFFKMAWENIKIVWDTVTSYFEAVFNSIKLIFSAVTSVLHGDFSGAWDAIKGVVDTWKGYFEGVWNNIKAVFGNVANYFSSVFQSAYNAVTSIFSNLGSFFNGIWETVKNTFSTIGTTIGNAIGESFKNVINAIINFAENTINGFIRSINNVIGAINNIPGVQISRLNELNLPKLKVGKANIPYDNYLALLHKGERVLTAKENKNYSRYDNDNFTVIDFNPLNDLVKEYLPQILNATLRQKEVRLDTGVLVGATVNNFDIALNDNAIRRMRGG